MFISFPIFILILIVLAYYFRDTEADKIITEMRDPGGLRRQAAIDAKRADKAAKKLSRGPAGTVVIGVMLLCALLGGVWLAWGSIGLLWIVWLVIGPLLVAPAMLALNRWFHSSTNKYQSDEDRAAMLMRGYSK